ncbi:MAG: hypothetical protein AB7P00_43270, partial [Sandaracinaceae bacterium]
MSRGRRTRVGALASSALASALVCSALVTLAARAQTETNVLGGELGAMLDEERAWEEARTGHHIKARELAEAVLEDRPDSFIAHFVLGFVHHYGEANFARALYHHERAMQLFVQQYGDTPEPPAPWRWHARILRELAFTHGDLEHYQAQLEAMARYSELYEPDFIAERAWPFMKMRRFQDAREAAELGEATGDPRQIEVALNALCAIEFEAGNDEASYRACRAAMELNGGTPQTQSAVDFTNFAEAARGMFRLDEAERTDLLATEAQVSWYGNPWVELGELYVREGRFVEALSALRSVPEYREQRPPHVRDADRNEARRALGSFFLVIGRSDEALDITEKALNAPDRRAHNSRDPEQDRAISALLHRAALDLRAERRIEQAVGAPFYERAYARMASWVDRARGWITGRVAARALADEERLVGTFMIGTHRSAVMPPWLVGELTRVLGAGVMREAIVRARHDDARDGAEAYYDAFEAEAALEGGDPARARELARRAADALNPAEAMLRARVLAVLAQAARDEGDLRAAADAYGEAFQADPGIFRRMGLTVPVSYELSEDALAEDVGDHIDDSGRFADEGWGLRIAL